MIILVVSVRFIYIELCIFCWISFIFASCQRWCLYPFHCCIVVCCIVVCCVVLWCGVLWCGMVWYGMVWCGVLCCVVVWCGVVWCHGVCLFVCLLVCLLASLLIWLTLLSFAFTILASFIYVPSIFILSGLGKVGDHSILFCSISMMIVIGLAFSSCSSLFSCLYRIAPLSRSMYWLPSSKFFVCALCPYFSHLYSFHIERGKHQHCFFSWLLSCSCALVTCSHLWSRFGLWCTWNSKDLCMTCIFGIEREQWLDWREMQFFDMYGMDVDLNVEWG